MAIQIWQSGDKIKNDRFHIIKQLGTGGFGITYLAEDTSRKQQIVIKTLNANQQSHPDFAQKQENFVKEGFTLRTFNHPHIVKVYEPIQIGDLWGLVMEYIPGQDLADYIIANGRLGEDEALNYINQIAQALDCVHQQKFFHRDVKPHNIMLRQDRGEAVLIDFGIAKEFVDLETIYLSNSLGTELYKPIEQYEKRGQFGAYTDIYALAVTLYHLLTGAAPGGGSPLYTSKARKDAQDKGWGANLDEHLWGELANAGVSERTQAAIKAGMEIDPSQRPQNMMKFRQLLELNFKPLRNVATLFDLQNNPEIDTFDRDVEAISFDNLDDDPFAGLSDLLGEEIGVGQAVQSFFTGENTPTIERNDVSGNLYSKSQITLVSPSPTQAYAHWEISVRLKRQLREQGGQKLLVRLYDVTDIADVDYTVMLPAHFQEFEISESDWELEIPIKQANRRYLTEIGYVTEDKRWLLLTISKPLWIRGIENNSPNQQKSSPLSRPPNLPKQSPQLNRNQLELDVRGVLGAFRRGQRIFHEIDVHNLDLSNAHLPGIILESANCAYINLSGANLAGGKFEKTNFTGAVLKNTILSKGYFSYANLQDADLSGADISDAYLNDANLRNADLRGANLKGVKVTEEQLNQAKTNFMTIFPNGKRGGFW
jgi:serine/threonine protein kinase